tara:strand:- start:3943 stop:4350 length:408 start_codon:yes stop_codon:yes gene_type:complete
MTTQASHTITCFDALIFVNLKGHWSIQNDLAYLSDLAEVLAQMRGKVWTLLVDMRGWHVPDSIRHAKYHVDLDRRNQKAECWIVDNPEDNEYLFAYFAGQPVQPQRCLTMQSAQQFLLTLEIVIPAELLAIQGDN